MTRADLIAAAECWLRRDDDEQTRAELDELVRRARADDAAAVADLADRFAGPLTFGTAGLRGALGAGPNRMNRVVVRGAAAGLGRWLSARWPRPRVVIGYDARRMSDVFARDSAGVLTGAGCEVLLLPGPLPTPVLAFAVRRLDADAGVMVTASHNPAGDNGCKVYLGGRAATGPARGVLIVPPADAEIAAEIAAVARQGGDPPGARARAGWQVLTEEVVGDYLAGLAQVVLPGPRRLSVVLTSLHGVGGALTLEALRRAGFTDVSPVAEQADPDPAFPTTPFPNPEEAGVLDLAIGQAHRVGADLVVATDPDADRCAVAVPERSGSGWRVLTGDEVGVLLGQHLARRGPLPRAATMASSVVSSSLLAKVAAALGVRHATTLTGFKWIARVPDLVFGYEEALGYCVCPQLVRDKDGISAILLVCELAARLASSGRSLLDELDELAVAYGVHATGQVTLRLDDPGRASALVHRLRAHPPSALGGTSVDELADLSEGVDGLPPTEGLRFRTADGARVIVRPSGTEPKVKCYLEVVESVAGDLDGARRLAGERMTRLRDDVRRLL